MINNSYMLFHEICIGNYMRLSVIGYNLTRKWRGNFTRQSRVQFSHFRVQLYTKLRQKSCYYLFIIIYFIKCSLIFQESYM